VGSGRSPLILVIAVSVLIGVGIDRIAVSHARKRSKTPDTPNAASFTAAESVLTRDLHWAAAD
jgi:hypothetical protein